MLEEICAVVHARSSSPALIEIARTHRGGRIDRTIYAWSTGRITATIDDDSVTLQRRRGAVSNARFHLDARELDALVAVFDDWAARRSSWAAFYVSTAGYPPGFGGAAYYQAAGDDAVPAVIGRDLYGRPREGEWLRGRDDVRPLGSPLGIGHAIQLTAQIWRVGENHGDTSGELVGCVYASATIRIFAYRRHVRLVGCDGRELFIEAAETELPRELVAVWNGVT